MFLHIIQRLFYGNTIRVELYNSIKYVDRLRLAHSHEQSPLALVRRVEMRLFDMNVSPPFMCLYDKSRV